MTKPILQVVRGSGDPEPQLGPVGMRTEILHCRNCGNTGDKGPFEGMATVTLRLKIYPRRDVAGKVVTGKYEPHEMIYPVEGTNEVITRCLACGSDSIERIPIGRRDDESTRCAESGDQGQE